MERTKRSPESIGKQVTRVSNKKIKPEEEDLIPCLPTGSVMLNIACGEMTGIGYSKGKLVNCIGDSDSGKTLLNLSALAEVARNKNFDDYELIFDDVESALEFNINKLFGQRTESRIKYKNSENIDDWQNEMFRVLDSNKPFIYILDSFDALAGREEEKTVREKLSKRIKGEKTTGTYGDGKAKASSEILRLICSKVKKSNGLLIVISQTRDDINPMTFTKKVRSGGKALTFYATHIIWLAKVKSLRKTIKGFERIIGSQVRAKVSKNKLTGKPREVDFYMYYDYGIDDIQSCIEFLVKGGFWRKTGNTIHAKNLKVGMTKASLIKHIEDNGLEEKVFRAALRGWLEIEEGLKLNRKGKF